MNLLVDMIDPSERNEMMLVSGVRVILHQFDLVRAFVRARLPADAKVEFSNFGGAPAIELPFNNPALVKTRSALSAEWGKKAVTVGEGGSIPIVGDFKRVLGMDTIMVGFALDDDRVHSPNEKYDLTSFHKGTRSWARILAALAE